MHLFPNEWDQPPPSSVVPSLEISVREPATGRVLAQIVLRLTSSPERITPMRSVATSGAAQDVPLSHSPDVAGRIDAPPDDLQLAIDSWLQYLSGRKKKQGSIDSFRQVVERAMRLQGWRSIGTLTFESVTKYLGSQGWKGTTYNRNLSVFRSLTKHMKNTGRITEDPLELAERADEDDEDGSRAATIEEARAIILHAWIRDQADRRCKGNRALYWLCLFSHACRISEPALWRRKNLHLNEPVPFVMWTPDINKGRKRRDCALAPELVEQLRLHLARQDADRKAAGLPPLGAEDRVFDPCPSKHTFPKDRDGAGVAPLDFRGEALTSHSARKYFSTVLGLRVREKMIDYLMRHTGRVEHRYFKPTLERQAPIVARLPRLWPNPDGQRAKIVDNSDSGPVDLTKRPQAAEDGVATSDPTTKSTSSDSHAGPEPGLPKWQRGVAGIGPACDSEVNLRAAVQGRRNEVWQVEPGPITGPEIGISCGTPGKREPMNP